MTTISLIPLFKIKKDNSVKESYHKYKTVVLFYTFSDKLQELIANIARLPCFKISKK